ncbi:unnamed protein product [Notodromas monacha]|uniref:AH domain-containing protein n=1 Tax=Notodromas monacha TaxID=399045 RepID=A0A7R9GEZ0_9CRUS|nr:unnamed protein product [Notodromas monacha]CAG0918576.1 unnamed protein product [Notodromas monacha]
MNYGASLGGVSGLSFDKYIESQAYGDSSTLEKFQHQFYVAKEAVTRKLNRSKSDKDVTASDSELDMKLELFRSIQVSSVELHKAVLLYQQTVCHLAQAQNSLGRFLKEVGKSEKAYPGKVMFSVGKVMSYSAYYALAIKEPIDRLQQEIETYRLRAVQDCLRTVLKTEKNRQEYRGMLIWMKEISEELNPDAYKQLEKFRKVQHQVRSSKQRFDKDKLDCMQKVDLLAASRCNMFSHALQLYQENVTTYWNKTDKACEAALTAINSNNFAKDNLDAKGADSNISLDLEKSSDIVLDNSEALIDVDLTDAQLKEDLLGELEIAKEATEDLDELFKKFSESRLGEREARNEPVDCQLDDVLGLTELTLFGACDNIVSDDIRSIFETVSGDLLTGNDGMSGFLPSQLLEQNKTEPSDWISQRLNLENPAAGDSKPESKPTSWLNAFAELDPLGKESKNILGEQA